MSELKRLSSETLGSPSLAKISRRKMFAILMMYSGLGYYGMQRNETYPTIEGELLKALLACNQLKELSSIEYKKVFFQRASKTDKSVSALGQVCSLQLTESKDLVKMLNSYLPHTIRILDILRVTRHFSAKTACCSRIYDYLLPTYAFAHYTSLSQSDYLHWKYRITDNQLKQVNLVLKRFLGTHNYFNFTSRRSSTDKSCFRYIINIECLPPFLLDDRQYAVIRIIGQSFMLHQIRKMIGLTLAIVRGHTDESIFDIAFDVKRIDIPKAPGLGLMLNQVVYNKYNRKLLQYNVHEQIDWEKYQSTINDFRFKQIYPYIDKTEVEEKSMLLWLSTLFLHTYTFFDVPPDNTSSNVIGDESETIVSKSAVYQE